MSRGRIHTQVADLLDRTVRINGDLAKLILKKMGSGVGRAGLEPHSNGLPNRRS